MTGPEHYEAAVDLIASVGPAPDGAVLTFSEALALAQVHAALALAAATAMNDAETGHTGPEWDAWFDACGTKTDG